MEDLMKHSWSIDSVIDLLCDTRIAAAVLTVHVGVIYQRLEFSTSTISPLQYASIGWCLLLIVYRLFEYASRNSIEWSEQLAIVTGSSGGLGDAIVSDLRERGCRIAAVDIKQSVKDSNGGVLYLQEDIADAKAVQSLKDKIENHFDRSVTIVISNAGIMVGKKVLDFDEGEFEQTIRTNFLATYYLIKTFLPGMLATGQGHIVAISSIMGYISISQLTDYVASKHALVGFLESLQYELDKKYKAPGIRTTLVILGKLSTPLFARTAISPFSRFFTPTQDPAQVAKAIIDKIERGQRGALYLPYLARLAPVLKALPDGIRNLVQWASGADEALQEGVTSQTIDGDADVQYTE